VEKGGGEYQTVGEVGPREARVARGQWEAEKGRGDEEEGGEALVTRGHGWRQVEEGGEDCCRHLKIHQVEYYVGDSISTTPLVLLLTVKWLKSPMV